MIVNALEINQNTFTPAMFSNVSLLLNKILPLVTLSVAVIFLFMLLLAGFNVITAGDNPEKIKKAQQTISFAILGLIVVVSSFLIVKLIAFILKVNVLPL